MSSTSPASHALRISAADAVVTVLTTEAAVADWLTSYLGSWWTVQELPTAADVSDVPVLRCSLDPAAYRSAHEHAHSQPHHVVEFARKPILVASRFDAVHAIDPDEQVDYHAAQNGVRQVTLVGAESLGLCLAAARIARELVRVELEASGWSILHASAVVHDHSALLSVGPKGAGKTTAALLLARDGWQLLANDRVFLHPATLALLPWPSAAALGIGLLHAHGLLDGGARPTGDRAATAPHHRPRRHRSDPRRPHQRNARLTGSRTQTTVLPPPARRLARPAPRPIRHCHCAVVPLH
ncbi:MAG: hypothetical protein ACRDSN_00215 [Pseudonocardiaceae bacterium]